MIFNDDSLSYGGRSVSGFGLRDVPQNLPLCGFSGKPECDRYTMKAGHRYVAGGIFLYQYKPDFPMAEEDKQEFLSSLNSYFDTDWVKALAPPNDLGAASPGGLFRWALSVIFQGYAKKDFQIINGATQEWIYVAQVPDGIAPPTEPSVTPPTITSYRGVQILSQSLPGSGCVAAFVYAPQGAQPTSFDVQDTSCDGAITKAKARVDSILGGTAPSSSGSSSAGKVFAGVAAGVVLAGAVLLVSR